MTASPDRQPDGPDKSSGRRGGGWLLFAGALVVGGLVAYLIWRFPGALSARDDQVGLVYYLLLAALLASGLLLGRRVRPRGAIKAVLIWGGLGLALVVGYGYRLELGAVGERVLGELLPHQGLEVGDGVLSFRAGAGGHFRVEARVDGRAMRFLVDTGASDIVLSPADAARLGFDLGRLSFSRRYRTANGQVMGAPVTLGEVRIGPFRFRRVRAYVNGAAMGESLLGMSFLERFDSYEVRGGTLFLRRSK